METKQLNIKVKGKDGFVETSTIQRHKPTAPMLLILLKTGHFLFCQNNHPIYIKDSNDNIKCLDAMYANINEKIYVDNSSCRKYIDKELTKNILDPSETIKNILLKNFKKLPHMSGDSYSNLRFTPDFIKYDNIWSYIFVYYFIKNISINEKFLEEISSNIIFIQQLKIIADKANIFLKPIFDNTVDYLKLIKFEVDYLEDTSILKINDYIEIEDIITINNYDDYVYDIKTITSEFLISNVQTHNSFHCIKKEQLLYIMLDGNKTVTSFEKLWDVIDSPINIINEEEIKNTNNLLVWDKDKFTKVNRILRHKKQNGTKMVMLRSNNGDFIISQDNHPTMLSENIRICKNCNINLNMTVNNNATIWECLGCKKYSKNIRNQNDNNYQQIQPKHFVKSKYHTYNSFPIWQEEKKKCIIDPYLFGMFLAEGSYLYYYEGTKLSGLIITQGFGDIYNLIVEKVEAENTKKFVINRKITTPQIIIYDSDLAEKMLSLTDRYSYQKNLGRDFIYYSDEDLSKIVCGIIDGDGSYIEPPDGDRCYISLETTSLTMVQQIHHILTKFNINHSITLATIKKLTRHQSYVIKIYPTNEDYDFFKYSVKAGWKELPKRTIRNHNDSLVTYMKEILFDEEEFVYDFTTESGTLTTNGVWTHNTASNASFSRFNIMEEMLSYLDDSYLNQINLFFKQVDDDLILKANKCRIKINKKILVDDYKIKYDELKKKYFIPLGYVDIEVGNFTVPLRIEQDINIYDSPEKVETDELLILEFNAKDKIIEVVPRPSHPEKIALKLDELVGGKSPFNSPEELFNKIHKTLQLIGIGYDAVHLEVAISNILRNKKDPQIPARLKEPYEFQTFSVKTLPSKMSWSLGMAFENFGQAISTGLISDRSPASPIEKILFGEPLSELSIELIKKAKNSRK